MDIVYSKPISEDKKFYLANRRKKGVSDKSYRNEKRDGFIKIFLYFIIIFFSLLILFKVSFEFFIADKISIKNIEVSGSNLLSENDIISMIALDGGKGLSSIDLSDIENVLESEPLIKDANVSKSLFGTLYVSIVEREPVCLTLFNNGVYSVPVAIDEDGHFIQIGRNVVNQNLLVLSGLNLNRLSLNSRLTDSLMPLLSDLYILKNDYFDYYYLLSEIRIDAYTNESFDVLLYLKDYKVAVRVLNRISKNDLQYILVVLNTLKDKIDFNYIKEFDFRSDNIIFTTRAGEVEKYER